MMKVYAEYVQENGLEFRGKTLLQFGNSWELIGSVVLKNPGSARPESPLSFEEEKSLKDFFGSESLQNEQWFQFRPDPTMRFIEKIFNGEYVDKPIILNGIIQLFNLTHIKDPDVGLVKEKIEKSSPDFLFPKVEEIVNHFKGKPVYLGWFDFWKKIPETEQIARGVFEYLSNGENNYLNPVFENNNYYHPMTINIYYKKINFIKEIQNFNLLFI